MQEVYWVHHSVKYLVNTFNRNRQCIVVSNANVQNEHVTLHSSKKCNMLEIEAGGVGGGGGGVPQYFWLC